MATRETHPNLFRILDSCRAATHCRGVFKIVFLLSTQAVCVCTRSSLYQYETDEYSREIEVYENTSREFRPDLLYALDTVIDIRNLPEHILSLIPKSWSRLVSVLILPRAPWDLRTYLDTHQQDSLPQKLSICCSAAYAVCALNDQGFLHRDIKTRNMVIDRDVDVPSMFSCKLIDFGLARRVDKADPLDCYTPINRSPECLAGCRKADFDACAAEAWALGTVLYEIITGKELLPRMAKETESIDLLCITFINRYVAKIPADHPASPLVIPYKRFKVKYENVWKVFSSRLKELGATPKQEKDITTAVSGLLSPDPMWRFTVPEAFDKLTEINETLV